MGRNELCEKLSQCRKMCVGMNIPEETFAVSEYIAANFYEEVYNPTDLALVLAKIFEEEQKDALAVTYYFQQIIDVVADDITFSENFREICGVVLGYNPPRIIKETGYPRYAILSAEWWCKEILTPSTDDMPYLFARLRRKDYSDNEVNLFKCTLANQIMKKVEKEGSCYIQCNWSPDEILSIAGKMLGIDANVGYPVDTQMMVFETEIRVSKRGMDNYEIIKV